LTIAPGSVKPIF